MSGTSVSRAIQRVSGWPYQKCLQWWRAHCAELAEGPGTRSERAVALWRQKEAVVSAPREVAAPKAEDEES